MPAKDTRKPISQEPAKSSPRGPKTKPAVRRPASSTKPTLGRVKANFKAGKDI